MADKSDISDSNSDSEGEKHDEEGKDDQSKTMVEQRSSVFSKFTEMTGHFSERVEQTVPYISPIFTHIRFAAAAEISKQTDSILA